MVAQAWQVAVSQLGGTAPASDVNVTASNWMGALKAARLELGEEGTVPPGASCAVAPDGTVTVLDAASRRRFTLRVTEQAPAQPPVPMPPPPAVQPPQQPASQPEPRGDLPGAAGAARASRRKHPLAQTVAMIPEGAGAGPSPRVQAVGAPVPTLSKAPALRAPDLKAAGAPKPAPVADNSRRKSPLAQTVGMIPEPKPTPAAEGSRRKSPLAQTVGMIPEEPAPAATAGERRPRRKFETVAFSVDAVRAASREIVISDRPPPPDASLLADGASKPTDTAAKQVEAGKVPPARPFTPPTLELLFERNEEPTPDNPLTYRERAYLIPPKASVMDAEASLRFRLEALRQELKDAGKGKFVSLAIFDHRWRDEPERPPLVVLEWKDWRGDPMVDYPAAQLSRGPSASNGSASASDRLATAFEALQQLEQTKTASAALEVVIDVLDQVIPSDAACACLYDIDTDELRFVAVSGTGAADRQGTAVSSKHGLLGGALAKEAAPTVVGDASLEPGFMPESDSPDGLDARNMLLRPLVGGGRTLGLLQLINRHDADGYSQDDINVLNYVADRVAEALVLLRQHRAS